MFAAVLNGQLEVHREWVHRTARGQRLLVTHGDRFDGTVPCAPWLTRLGDALYYGTVAVSHAVNNIHRANLRAGLCAAASVALRSGSRVFPPQGACVRAAGAGHAAASHHGLHGAPRGREEHRGIPAPAAARQQAGDRQRTPARGVARYPQAVFSGYRFGAELQPCSAVRMCSSFRAAPILSGLR
jgi:hypothetical protein